MASKQGNQFEEKREKKTHTHTVKGFERSLCTHLLQKRKKKETTKKKKKRNEVNKKQKKLTEYANHFEKKKRLKDRVKSPKRNEGSGVCFVYVEKHFLFCCQVMN